MLYKSDECVVLLHGLGRSSRSFKHFANHFSESGYNCIAVDYPSKTMHLYEIVNEIMVPLVNRLSLDYKKIHFICHSMGGILMRAFISRYHFDNIGRIVMIGTPNKGSEIATIISKFPLSQHIWGVNLLDLSYQSAFIKNLDNGFLASKELGIIAGELHSINDMLTDVVSFCKVMIPKPNDGLVTVDSTYIASQKDHLVVNFGHNQMLRSYNVHLQAQHFIENGCFSR